MMQRRFPRLRRGFGLGNAESPWDTFYFCQIVNISFRTILPRRWAAIWLSSHASLTLDGNGHELAARNSHEVGPHVVAVSRRM